MVPPEYVDEYHKLREVMSYFNLLKKNEQWYEDNKELQDKIEEYFRDNDPSHGWSFLEDIEYNYDKHEFKNFNEEYESFTRTFIYEILKYQKYSEYVIVDVLIKIYFRDSYDFNGYHEGDIVISF